jgi:hypothetical protein
MFRFTMLLIALIAFLLCAALFLVTVVLATPIHHGPTYPVFWVATGATCFAWSLT